MVQRHLTAKLRIFTLRLNNLSTNFNASCAFCMRYCHFYIIFDDQWIDFWNKNVNLIVDRSQQRFNIYARGRYLNYTLPLHVPYFSEIKRNLPSQFVEILITSCFSRFSRRAGWRGDVRERQWYFHLYLPCNSRFISLVWAVEKLRHSHKFINHKVWQVWVRQVKDKSSPGPQSNF